MDPHPYTPRRSRGALRQAALAVALAAIFALVPIAGAAAQADAPGNVTVNAQLSVATLTWGAVAGATSYEIERTHIVDGQPAGPGVIVGIWTPNRAGDLVTPGPLVFADLGFPVGERYRWRVRAVVGGEPGAWSEPVEADTPGHPGPQQFLSGFELSNGARWTTHEEEVALVNAIAAASDRVRVETIGVTAQGRPVQLAVIGDPAPGTPEEIAASGSVLIGGTVHGTERSGREGAMMLLRLLAFSDDPWVEEILEDTTVLIVPTQNPDGQANSTRGNTSGQDLNRDHLLLRHPENLGMARVIRDYRPDIIVDSHENPGRGGDMEFLWPRSRSVEGNLFNYNQNVFARGLIYGSLAQAGLSPLQWGTHRTDNWETLISNVAGLKNVVGLLQEIGSRAAAAHPAEGATGGPENQRRRAYSALWNMRNVLEIHDDQAATIRSLRSLAEAVNSANTGPVYIDGAYDIPVNPPVNEQPTTVLAPFCGYRLDASQYASRQRSELGAAVTWESETVAERLASHGVAVEEVGNGIVDVRMAQPLRPMIPLLFDPDLDTAVRPEGTPNISMVVGERLDDDRATVFIRGDNTRIPNRVTAEGCSINDLIADEQEWPNRATFARHVAEVVDELVADGVIDSREAATIVRRAERSGIS